MKLIEVTVLIILFFSSGIAISQNNELSTYAIVIKDQAHDIGRCAVNVEVEGVGNLDVIALAPQYAVNFSLDSLQTSNKKIKVKGVKKWGIPPNNAPACNVNGEIYLNQLILDEWKPIKEKFSGTRAMNCVDIGVNYLGVKIDGPPEANTLYARVNNPKLVKLFDVCDKIVSIDLNNNVSCELSNGLGKSMCNEGYFSASDPSGRKIDFNVAVVAAYNGEEIKKGIWETKEAEANRLAKIAKQESERLARQKEREERAKWLQTPEGKNWTAQQEAQARKEEETRQKVAAVENARVAKEFPFYAVISCGIGTGHMTITACFSGDYGSLEVKNGGDYGLYKIVQIINRMIPNSNETSNGLVINLRDNFEITARNGEGKNLILGLKIIKRSSNATVFQKQVDNFGTIRVKN